MIRRNLVLPPPSDVISEDRLSQAGKKKQNPKKPVAPAVPK